MENPYCLSTRVYIAIMYWLIESVVTLKGIVDSLLEKVNVNDLRSDYVVLQRSIFVRDEV